MVTQGPQSAFSFLISQTAYIEADAYRTKYASIQYPDIVPVVTEANEWTRTITHFSTDGTGQAEWFGGRAMDMPLSDVTATKYDVSVEMAAIGYDYSLEELNQASMAGVSLPSEKAIRARRAAEELIESVVMNGNAARSWDSLIDHSAVTKMDAADGAAGTNPKYWVNKTADEIIADVNALLSAMWTETNQVEIADTLLVPPSCAAILASLRIPDTMYNVGEYVMEKNVSTLISRRPLMIRTVRELENAAASGHGRIIAYRNDPEILRLHLPMPYMFGEPLQKGHYNWEVPGIFRTGGLEIRLPRALHYLDEVTA